MNQINSENQITIVHLNIGHNSYYMSKSDADISTDYFSSISFKTMKYTIEAIKEQGGNIIKVTFDDKADIGQINRAYKIAKSCGYKLSVNTQKKHQEMDGIRHEWTETSGLMERVQ